MVGASGVLLLTGCTCSGKSALALALAQAVGGVIINADAMQIYADLRVLTARPTERETAHVPHRLYGVLGAEESGSVAKWLALAVPEIRRAWEQGRLPILVGGTGMYLKALMHGLAEVPEIPPEVRRRVRGFAADAPGLHALLAARDPAMAARLKPGDAQRILRALEVFEATGQSLAEWQASPAPPPLPEARFLLCATEMPRPRVYARIDRRFETMMEEGAPEEVRSLRERHAGAAPEETRDWPLWRAHGVPELLRYLDGGMTRGEAAATAQRNTRRYAKRQSTWLRNQFPQARRIALSGEDGDTEQASAALMDMLSRTLHPSLS